MMDFINTHGSKILYLVLGGTITAIIKYVASEIRVRQNKRQQLFEDYSKRYSEILSNLLQECESFDNEFDPKSPIQRKLALQFIMLLSEEFFLNQKKLIDKDIWEIWKCGIEYHFSTKFFQTAWTFSISQMDLKGDFSTLVESSFKVKEINMAAA